MYERLDKLRAEVERCKKRIEDDKGKLRAAEQRLQEAENSQILADVGALNLSPEQLAEFLKLATSGQLGNPGTSNAYAVAEKENVQDSKAEKEDDDYDLEGIDDEENETEYQNKGTGCCGYGCSIFYWGDADYGVCRRS